MSVTEKNITINPIVNGVKDTNTNLYPKTKVENLVDFPSPASNFNKFLHTNAIDGSIEWATVGVPTGAFSFIGTTTTALTDGSTTNPITIGGESVTATNGNVVIYGNKEFAWTGSYWEELGNEGVASSTALGNVKLGSDTTIDSTAAKTYPIQLNSNNQMYVNVPWTDNNTTYSLATTSSSGLLRALESSSVSSQTQSTKFLREDGTWAAPSYTTNTNYYQTPDYSAGLKIATGTGVNDLYVPYATTSSAGSVSVGSGLSISSGALSVDTSVIATKSDLPSGEVDVNFNDTTSTVTTTTALSNITLVGDTRYTITSTRETAASGGTTLSLVNTNDMYVWNNKQDALVPEHVQGTLASVLGFDSSMQVTDGKVTSDVISSGNATNGQVLKANGSGDVSWGSITVPSITLNGSSTTTPSFYAPTSAGTSGYYLKSNGSGAPTWAAISIPNVVQDLTSNTAGTLDATAWSNLKSSHFAVISSPTMTGLDSAYEFVNIKLSINSNNEFVKLTKNTSNKYSGLFFIEDSTVLYELTAYYNGSVIMLRCATDGTIPA